MTFDQSFSRKRSGDFDEIPAKRLTFTPLDADTFDDLYDEEPVFVDELQQEMASSEPYAAYLTNRTKSSMIPSITRPLESVGVNYTAKDPSAKVAQMECKKTRDHRRDAITHQRIGIGVSKRSAQNAQKNVGKRKVKSPSPTDSAASGCTGSGTFNCDQI